MTLKEIVSKFEQYPKALTNGAGNLSKRWNCKKEDIYRAREIVRNRNPKLPKILVFDIETSPLKAYVWSRWKQNIHLEQTISEWFMLTWSAKWLFSTDVMSNRLTPEEVLNEDDSRIVKGIWELINEADIIIAHNGERFDTPRLNSRFIINELNPPSPYQQIDTLKAAREFGFSSNKLDALATYFGIETKLRTDFELWSKCMDGDEESLKYMEEYNRKDVDILEEVYLRIRPWIKRHPNISLYLETNKLTCSNCGSDKIVPTDRFYYTAAGKYKVYKCACGTHTRGRKNLYDKSKKDTLTLSLGR